MAATNMSKLTYAKWPLWQQVLSPLHRYNTFDGDDTDNHDYRVDCRGKSKAVVAVHNATNKDLTVTVYGAHAADAEVGDDGTFEIDGPGNGSFTVAAANDWNYEVLNDPFPWIIIRCTFSATPDGEAVKLYVDLQQGG